MNAFNMTCEAVEVTLPDYLDETLEGWVRTSVQEHLSGCMRCSALVRDLRNIEREAAALPDLVPARDLWPGVASRIGAPVVAFEPPAVTPVETAYSGVTPIEGVTPIDSAPSAPARRRRATPLWMGAAAAALVVLTAGTTYLLTSRTVKPSATGIVVSTPTPTEADLDSALPSDVEPSTSVSEATPARARRGAPAPNRTAPPLASRSPAEAVYEKEIVMLQAIMSWRKSQLDPATAAIIEKNLKIIDAAIAQSKEALRRDPASSMLSDQLSHTLDKKVELLRTAAMLPAST